MTLLEPDLTAHQLHGFNRNCEHCAETPFNQRYENEMRKCWLQMTVEYPHLYSIDDYFTACRNAEIMPV